MADSQIELAGKVPSLERYKKIGRRGRANEEDRGPKTSGYQSGGLVHPIEELNLTLCKYYNKNEERHLEKAQGHADDVRHEISAPTGRGKGELLPEDHRRDRVALVDYFPSDRRKYVVR